MQSIDIFPWNDNFNIGLPEVDQQHRKLVQLLNLLASHMAFRTSAPDLSLFLDELADYAVNHFRMEEAIWHDYMPGDEAETRHKETHQSFVQTIQRLKEDQATKSLDEIVEAVLDFLTRWLASHIVDGDRQLANVVLAIKAGMSLGAAKERAAEQMDGSTRALIDIILAIYGAFSNNTLKLMRELAEHRRVERNLAQECEKNQILLRNASDGIHILDSDGNVLEASDSFCEMLGYTRDEVIGMNAAQWDAGLSGDEIKEVFERQISEPGRHQFETRHRRRDGSVFEVEVSGTGLTLDGRQVVINASRDISERKRYEQQMHDNEALYRVITENSKDVIWTVDLRSNRVTYISPSVQNLLGYLPGEIIGQAVGVTLTPESAALVDDRVRASLQRIAAGDRSNLTRTLEVQHPHRDGHIISTEMVVTYVLDQTGAPVSMVGVSRDVTERKRAEAALRESEERHRLIVESAAEGFWMIDTERRTTDVNSALCNILGYSPEEMIGRRPGEFADEQNQKIFEAQMSHIGDTHHRHYEIQLRHKDGRNIPLYFQATTHFNTFGAVNLAFAFVTDLTERRRTEEQLARRELELKTIIDNEPECVKLLAADGTLLQMNRAGLNMIDADSPGQAIGKKIQGVVMPQYRGAFMALTRRVFKGESGMLEFETVGFKGTHRWLETHAVPLRDPQGNITALLGVTRDITARKAADHALRIAAIAFESQEGMIVTDAGSRILQVNSAFTTLTGYLPEDVIGRTPSMLKSGSQTPEFYQHMWHSLETTGAWQGEIWNRRKDGEIFPEWLVITAVKGADGSVTNYVGAFTDLTQRKDAERQILNLAFYDALTGLPNRRLLNDRLDQARTGSQRTGHHGALVYLDLDRFKSLNDSQGHTVGDELLREVAKRLQSCVRDGDTVARLGGDEFVIMLEDLAGTPADAASQAEYIAEKILNSLDVPYQLGRFEHHSSASIGVTLFRGKEDANDELLKRADLAMYQAKASGRNTIRFFDPAMQAAVLARSALEAELRRALKQGDFILHYQPQFDSAGSVVSVEALARWQHSERGLVSPVEFIPLAEETGLIVPIGHLLMLQACTSIKAWSKRPETSHLSVAVNVSPRQFHDQEFVGMVLGAVEATGANPDQLVLEITEGLLLDNLDGNIAKMTTLREHGIRFSIDDFGTGYSSLAYLKRLPLDELKIDRTFVADIGQDDNAAIICSTFINLAHLLGLRVVAEGVETAEQRHFLSTEHHCDVLQGFLLSPPLSRSELDDFLKPGRPLH